MKITESYIYLVDLKFHSNHGVTEQERLVGNDYLVNLRVGYDISKAMESDDVNDTMDYANLYVVVADEMREPSCLLECAAGRIGRKLFSLYPKLLSVDLKLTKLNPPMGADSNGAGIELHLINDKTEM